MVMEYKLDYDEDTFREMIREWVIEKGDTIEGLIVEDEVKFEDGKWWAYCHDDRHVYSLTDDGTNNIVINYGGIL